MSDKPGPIDRSIAYIEQNLQTDLSAAEIAAAAGYSVYHFCRLFAAAMGMPVAGYIQKRRLDHALTEISAGQKAIDVVLSYGFDTYAGFYKAFVRLYGCSPRKYMKLYPGAHPPPTLPEVKNDMLHEQTLRQLLAHWDVDSALPIQNIYLADGAKVPGDDWRVGTAYILCTGERHALIKKQAIARALAQQGFQALLPLKTKEGAALLDGANPCYLARSPGGRPLDHAARFGEGRQAYGIQYGTAIAGLHAALRQVQAAYPADEINLYDTVAGWALPIVRLQDRQWQMGLGDAFFDDWLTAFQALYPSLPRQLIHRDLHPGNICFDGGRVSGFLGFDLSEINVRLLDPCYCATGLLSEAGDDPAVYARWPGIAQGILQGYDRAAGLTPAEKRAVYYVLCAIQMTCIAYFQSIDRPAFQQLAKTNREMLAYIVRSREQISALA